MSQTAQRKTKPFRPVIMEFPVVFKVSEGMWKKIVKRADDFLSMADYGRNLIMRDLNIDEYGNERK